MLKDICFFYQIRKNEEKRFLFQINNYISNLIVENQMITTTYFWNTYYFFYFFRRSMGLL